MSLKKILKTIRLITMVVKEQVYYLFKFS